MTKAEVTFEKYAMKFPNVPKIKNFLKAFKIPKSTLYEGFIPGAIATGVSTGLIYPVDTFQMRAQSGLSAPKQVGEYYKGLGMKLVKAVPAGAIVFGLTPVLKRILMRRLMRK